jgi:hypothetical protein
MKEFFREQMITERLLETPKRFYVDVCRRPMIPAAIGRQDGYSTIDLPPSMTRVWPMIPAEA